MSPHARDLEPIENISEVLSSENVRKRRSRLGWGLSAALAIAVLGFFLARGRNASGPTFEFTELARADLEVTVTSVGTIEPLDEVDVGSELSGILREVLVDAGDTVQSGQVLARLDPEVLKAQADQARAQVKAAQASLAQIGAAQANAKRERDVASKLASQGAQASDIAQRAASAYDQSTAAKGAAQAQLRASRAVLRLAEVNLSKSEIKAPIAGVVLTRNAEVGQSVVSSLQAQTLFVIAQDLGMMQVVLDIDEADIARVRPGQDVRFTVAAFPRRTFEGTLLSVGLAPKPMSIVVTYEAIVGVDNTDKALVPGMTASANIIAATHEDVLVVHNAALRFAPEDAPEFVGEDGAGRLWRVGAEGPEAVEVDVGATDGRVTAVSGEGLAEGGSFILSELVP